jgi:alpha-beta hydrolase superfamily lysophospholipase
LLEKWGYISLRFDMRGCGESEGTRAHIICMEQVEDTSSAVTYLMSRPDVDPTKIATAGHSFGAAVSVYAGGVDDRIAAVISSGGWGDGQTKFELQHSGPGAWNKFSATLKRGKELRAKTGESIKIPRYDIVPIPEGMRGNLAPGSVMEFPLETVESMLAFRANDVVSKIAPRPLLLLHASTDSVTPTEQSIVLFQKAGSPTDLHLVADVDHFMFAENNVMVIDIVRTWLKKHLGH